MKVVNWFGLQVLGLSWLGLCSCAPSTGAGDAGALDAGALACAEGTFRAGATGPCAPWSACAAGQVQASPGSSTEDRRCAACTSGTFSVTVNATTCATWSTCAAGQRVTRPGTASSDRACEACATGTYTSGENQTVCLTAGACPAGTVQRAPATSTAAADCGTCQPGNFCAGGAAPAVPCGAGTWDHDGLASTACVPRTTCLAGQYAADPGSATQDRTCGACASGTFSTTSNATSCQPWATCPVGTRAADGTATWDRQCTACSSGTWAATPNAPSCAAWTHCAAGTFISTSGTASRDQACSPCASGTFSGADATACAAFSTCVAGQFLATQGTPTSDRVCTTCVGGFTTSTNVAACTPFTTCAAGTFTSPPGTPTSDRACMSCTTGTYTSFPNASGCVPWSICAAGQFVQATGTTSTNRACATCATGQTSTTNNATACTPGALIAVTVTGLAGAGLVLQNNLGDDLPVSAPGTFVFATPVAIGGGYSVTVRTQPTNSPTCAVQRGTGTANADVRNVVVECGLLFHVASEGGLSVPTARAVLVGPTMTIEGIADATGVVSVAFPSTERPFTMTVAAPGYEAVSIIGLTTEVPREVFIAPTGVTFSTAALSGSITGKRSATNLVNVDLYEGQTVTTSTGSYSSSYTVASIPFPVQVVALEVPPGGLPVNWVASPELGRTPGAQTFNVAFPADAGRFVGTSFSVTPASSGAFTASTVQGMTTSGFTAHYVGNSATALDGGATYAISGWLQFPAGGGITGLGVDGPLMPNRALYSLDGAGFSLRMWVRDPFVNPSNVVTAPVVNSLAVNGSALNNVSAAGSGVGFDTLELQVSGGPGGNTSTTYWRVYTAPGAPMVISHLPPLPTGISPASLGLPPGPANVMAMLVRFAEPASRPWVLPGGNWSVPIYSVTVSGLMLPVVTLWP